MGRIKKYQTEDERILKQREYSKKYILLLIYILMKNLKVLDMISKINII